MTQYSSYRPIATSKAQTKEAEPKSSFLPIAVVGAAMTAALMVLLLLTQSQLSQISFEISALEQELAELERRHEKLVISYAKAYSPERIERYATEQLGMVQPNPDQIRYIYIDTAPVSRKEPN